MHQDLNIKSLFHNLSLQWMKNGFSFFSIWKYAQLVVCLYLSNFQSLSLWQSSWQSHLPPAAARRLVGVFPLQNDSHALSGVLSNWCLISTWATPASEEGCELIKHMLHFYLFMSHYLKVLSPDCHT